MWVELAKIFGQIFLLWFGDRLKKNAEIAEKRKELKNEAKQVWENSPTRSNVDRIWSKLRR